ncbi:MAG TPA: hypothetical protein VE961_15005 [Pyrinomonadaceae bacterium]|nr:hypothetical protein [Pyrinomonadaceae bacterium]
MQAFSAEPAVSRAASLRGIQAKTIQRSALPSQSNLANFRLHASARGIIQRIQKDLVAGGTVDVEELDDQWISRMLDAHEQASQLKAWKRRGTNPTVYNGDTFYSEPNGKLRPLTAEAVNAYWDEKYPGFTRSGSPTPLQNCEDYATGGANYQAGTTYDLNTQGDREALKVVLDNGRHVLQLGALRANAHFLIADNQGGNVTISQKDGDSAIYSKVMSATDAVAYVRSKHATVIELRPA